MNRKISTFFTQLKPPNLPFLVTNQTRRKQWMSKINQPKEGKNHLKNNNCKSELNIKSSEQTWTATNYKLHEMFKAPALKSVDSIKPPAIFRSALTPWKTAGCSAFPMPSKDK